MSATNDHLADETLSALLDGEATPDEATHVASCDVCARRADELRAASQAIGRALPAVDESRGDAAIVAAVAARTIPLVSRRRRPALWAVGAAAALVLAAVLIPTLAGNRSSTSRRSDTAASAPAKERAPGADATGDQTAGALAAPTAPVDAGDLGNLGNLGQDDVQRRVTAALQAPPGRRSPEETSTATPSCDAALASANPGLGPLRLFGRATVQGRSAQVLAYETAAGEAAAGDGRLRVFVVAVDDCADVLLDVTFDAP